MIVFKDILYFQATFLVFDGLGNHGVGTEIWGFSPTQLVPGAQTVFVGTGRELLATNIDFGNAEEVETIVTTGRDAKLLRIMGTSGADSMHIAADNGVLTVTVNGVTQQQSLAGIEQLEVLGRQGNDAITLRGLKLRTTVKAGAGDDTVDAADITTGVLLFGEKGADTLIGGVRADLLQGGSGDDVLKGQAGNDTLVGGPGTDAFRGGAGANTITDPENSRSASTATAQRVAIQWDVEPVAAVASKAQAIDWQATYAGAVALSSDTPSTRSSKTASAWLRPWLRWRPW